MVEVFRDIYFCAEARARFVDRVGDDLKSGVLAAVKAVVSEDHSRPLADAVGALQRDDALISVFLFLCHA